MTSGGYSYGCCCCRWRRGNKGNIDGATIVEKGRSSVGSSKGGRGRRDNDEGSDWGSNDRGTMIMTEGWGCAEEGMAGSDKGGIGQQRQAGGATGLGVAGQRKAAATGSIDRCSRSTRDVRRLTWVRLMIAVAKMVRNYSKVAEMTTEEDSAIDT
ncbi:hypothetical protein B296_00047657 [Ensete ventricosum]|uniref:Uncharacterized protein n=1 Tax=Ensete ventricosum TaxID=4639 RepID=A0A426YB14_ENSVE|nr:hypothetical protein B296_00047657 [Ensete ventricosum]